MSEHHENDKKSKKLAQLLKNRRIQHLFQADADQARGRDLEKEREEEIIASQLVSSRASVQKKKDDAEPLWSAKMQQIRDRNTGKMRDATERWNRFAGTESGGGRGL